MFPLLSPKLTVCAMDRRGHGLSGNSAEYSLQKESEDIVAVVESRGGPVAVLGHSYGGVAALEAAFMTDEISKLVLYEPPVQDQIDVGMADRIDKMIEDGEREKALETFFREVVKIAPGEIAAMHLRPTWPGFVATVETLTRQMRALAAYRFDPKRMTGLRTPTLLLTGSETASPELKQAIKSLQTSLPNVTVVVLEGEHHNAMDDARPKLAEVITSFLGKATPAGR